tara:strand:- start:36 stop:413 length:378 start_codon:yes stop_codon:yes gene_type:complete
MKYIIALSAWLLLVFTVSSASTQEQPLSGANNKTFITKQLCGEFQAMLKTPKMRGEQLLFTGNGLQFSYDDGRPYTGGAFFFVNQDTGTWSFISVYGDGIACLVSLGKDFTPYAASQSFLPKDDL